MNDQKHEDRKLKAFLIQWQQFCGMLLFLVVNRVHRNNIDDKLTDIFYIISFAVFLGATIKSFNDLCKLFPKVEKDDTDDV